MTYDNYHDYLDQIVDLLGEKIRTINMQLGVKITFNEPDYNSLNPSTHVWIENSELIGHIALWKNQTGEFSAVNFINDEKLFDYSCEIESLEKMSEHVERVIDLFRK